MATADCDVLIVGLGPVGAALGGLLVDAGVSVTVVEKDVEVYPLPRAAHFDHEAMRLFQQLGVADEVARHTRPLPDYEFRTADGRPLLRLPRSTRPAVSGWASGYMFNQPDLERALRAKLAASPHADILLGHHFVGLTQDPEGVRADIAGPGGSRMINARYLVGCDGARSRVREAIGATLDDLQFDEPWLVIDALAPEGVRTPALNLQICDPARPTTCVLMGPGRHRWEFMLLPGERAETVLDDGFIQGLLAPWDCGPALVIDRKAVYRFHGLVAHAWRKRRVLLAGDSAHQMPPFAGQGLCSGLRDAANLAWKLQAVLAGEADEDLLDTYQAERDPHVRAIIAVAIGMGRVVCTLDPAEAQARDAAMTAQLEAGGGALPLPPAAPLRSRAVQPDGGSPFPQLRAEDGQGLDDVLGRGPWLIAAAGCETGENAGPCIAVDAPQLEPFREALAAWLRERDAQAVLVRPDRYVFGVGDASVLRAAYRRALAGVNDRSVVVIKRAPPSAFPPSRTPGGSA